MVRIPGFHCCGLGSIPPRGTEITLALQCCLKKKKKDFPGSPVVEIPCSNAGGMGSIPGRERGSFLLCGSAKKTKPKIIILQWRVPFWVWVLFLSKKMWDLRFIHLVELYQLLVLCPCWRISIHRLEGPQLIYVLVGGRLDCFQFWVVKNKASVTITPGGGVGVLFFCLPLQAEIYLFSH